MEHAIVIQDVTKRFRETVAVSHVTACFETGKIHGIIGRNGSGKTVLFKCICGLFPVTEGSIEVLGAAHGETASGFLRGWGPSLRRRASCPTAPGIRICAISWSSPARRTGRESGGPWPPWAWTRQQEARGKVLLGMRQRLGLAQAMMEDPEL